MHTQHAGAAEPVSAGQEPRGGRGEEEEEGEEGHTNEKVALKSLIGGSSPNVIQQPQRFSKLCVAMNQSQKSKSSSGDYYVFINKLLVQKMSEIYSPNISQTPIILTVLYQGKTIIYILKKNHGMHF